MEGRQGVEVGGDLRWRASITKVSFSTAAGAAADVEEAVVMALDEEGRHNSSLRARCRDASVPPRRRAT